MNQNLGFDRNSEMNRAKEIQETIAKLAENIANLEKELKDIQRQCEHSDKEMVTHHRVYIGRYKYICNDCGDSWWA